MSGVPSYPAVSEPNFLFFLMIPICFLSFIGFCGFLVGDLHGRATYWSQEKSNCTKWEMRQFADTGFMFFSGSGEITTRNVCIEWVVKR
jgi:hypothetical protein